MIHFIRSNNHPSNPQQPIQQPIQQPYVKRTSKNYRLHSMFLRDPDQLDVNMCAYHEKMASLRCHQTWLAGKSPGYFFVGGKNHAIFTSHDWEW